MSIFSDGIGIDISDHHVRIARVDNKGIPKGLFELVLPDGLIKDDRVQKLETLKKEIKKLIVKAGLEDMEKDAVLLVPESRVFSASFLLSKSLKKDDLVNEAVSMAQEEIPIPFSAAVVNVHKGARLEDFNRVSICAVEKPIIDTLHEAFAGTPFTIEMLEANNAALNRAFRELGPAGYEINDVHDLLMIIDIGHRWTNITLYDKMNATVFSRSVALRELKDAKNGKMKELTKKQIKHICEAVKTTTAYYQEKGNRVPLGVVAGVEGAQEHICSECEKHVKKCNIERIGRLIEIEGISLKDVHTYGAAIGAAIRSAHPRKFSGDHFFQINKEEE